MEETTIIPVTRTALAMLLGSRALSVLAAYLVSLFFASALRRRLGDTRVRHSWAAPLLWALGFALPMVVAGFFGYDLFSKTEEADAARFANMIGAAGIVVGMRPVVDVILELIDARNEELGRLLRRIRDVLALSLAIYVACRTIEVPWNWQVDMLPPLSRAFTATVMVLVLLGLYFLGQRSGVLAALGVAAACFIGVAQYLVMEFRGVPFLPSDLSSIGTAAAVSEGYVFSLDGRCRYSIKLVALACAALCYVHPRRVEGAREHAVNIARNTLAGAALIGLLAAGVSLHDWRETFDLNAGWYWDEREAYSEHGFLPAFVSYWHDMKAEAPEDYTQEQARADEAALVEAFETSEGAKVHAAAQAQFDETLPSIIFVMNESFTDMSIFNGLNAGYEGPPFVKAGIDDALMQGNVAMTAYGGGTANTEFEVLAGTSVAYLGLAKIPYAIHDFTTTTSLVDQLESLGYETCAMHPENPKNYRRDTVYEQMGFDRFLSRGDWPDDAPFYHSGVRDSATYQTILDILAQSDKPQFVFDVTMANHGGYLRGNTAAADQQNVWPEGVEDEDPEKLNKMLNEFLACMHASDTDIEWFVAELRKLDRPVILVFWGDHQPSFSWKYNNYAFPDEDDQSLAHRARCYQTPYFIWANYDVEGVEQKGERRDTSTDALGALTLELIGAPLTDYQKTTLAGHDQLTQINGVGYTDGSGAWYGSDSDSPYAELYRQLCYVNYLEYGSQL